MSESEPEQLSVLQPSGLIHAARPKVPEEQRGGNREAAELESSAGRGTQVFTMCTDNHHGEHLPGADEDAAGARREQRLSRASRSLGGSGRPGLHRHPGQSHSGVGGPGGGGAERRRRRFVVTGGEAPGASQLLGRIKFAAAAAAADQAPDTLLLILGNLSLDLSQRGRRR